MTTIQEYNQTEEILTQKKKFLTFEELCNEWSHYISHVGGIEKIIKRSAMPAFVDSKQTERSLDDMRSCIVGEAHNRAHYWRFKTPTYCGECEAFSMGFYGSGSSKYCVDNEGSFEVVKSLFVNHFNEVHIQ